MNLIVTLTTFLAPLFFWTLTPNYFSTPKELLLSLAVVVSLSFVGYQIYRHRSLTVPPLSQVAPLIIFVLAVASSLFANPEGRPEALQSKGLYLILLPIFAYLVLSYNHSSLKKTVNLALLSVGSILALHSLMSLLILSKLTFLPTFMQTLTFTPTGSYPTTILYILVALPLAFHSYHQAPKQHRYPYLTLIALLTIAAIATLVLSLPPNNLSIPMLSLGVSWSIALDALKSLRSLLFGIGISNYSLLYTSVKPLIVNASPLWNALPQSGFSEILTVLPTAGILTTASLLYLTIRTCFVSSKSIYAIPTLLLLLSLFLSPATLPTYFLIFLFYGLSSSSDHPSYSLTHTAQLSLLAVLSLLALGIGFIATRTTLSEWYLAQAQLSLQANDSQAVYEHHLKALRLSPRITNYHLSFADINFRLASALSQKTAITDSERETIAKLVQQSIESSKASISLRPNDARTWLTIAKVYQSLITVAEGSESFALEAFSKAIALDRANPSLRLEYSSLLSQLASTTKGASESAVLNNRAISEVQLAIQLKSDYASAYVALADLLKRAGENSQAKQSLEKALIYLSPDSQEYSFVQTELSKLN